MFDSKKNGAQGLIDRGLLEYVRDRTGKLVLKTTAEGSHIIQFVEDFSSGDSARGVRGLSMMRKVFGQEYRKFRPEYLKSHRVVGRERKNKP